MENEATKLKQKIRELERRLEASKKALQKQKITNASIKKFVWEENLAELFTTRESSDRKFIVSERVLSYFLQTVPVGVIWWAPSGEILDANDHFLRMLDYSRQELLEKVINWTKIAPEYTPQDQAASREYLEKGKCHPYEKIIYGKTGNKIPVVISSVMLDPQSRDGLAFVLDVSELKRKEESLRHNQDILNEAQLMSNIGSWELDIATRRMKWSDHLYRIFHLEPEKFEPLFENLVKMMHPEDQPRLGEIMNRTIQEQSSFSSEYRIILPDGEIRHILPKGKVVKDESGKAVKVIGISMDITERKKSEQAIKESEERLRFHVDNSPLGVIEWDAGSVITRWSSEAEHIFGWKKEEVLGTRIDQMMIVYQEDKEIVRKAFERMHSGRERKVILSQRNLTKSGKLIECTWYNSVFLDEKGKLKSVMSLIQDITVSKINERNLTQMIRTLKAMQKSSLLMASAQDEKKFLEDVCQIIVEDCGHKMVWIGFKQKDKAKSVIPVAHAGFEQHYLDTLNITWKDTDRGRGPTGIAIRTGKPALCRNMLTDPAFEPWREQARKRGYSSSIALPIMMDDEVAGAVTIYSKLPDPFSEDEQQLLLKLANDLSYGIKVIRLNLALQQSKDDLEFKVKQRTAQLTKTLYDLEMERQRFLDVLNIIPAFVALINPDFKIKFANRIFKETFGELKEETCFEHFFRQGKVCAGCDLTKVLKSGEPSEWEWIGPNNRTYAVSGYPFVDTDGSSLMLKMGVDITDKKNTETLILKKIVETEEKDRKRFASDLHDDLGPTLSAIKLQLSMLSKNLTKEKKDEVLIICDQLLLDSINKMRILANNIMPSLIKDYGFETAIRSFTDRISRSGELRFRINSNNKNHRFDEETELHLYRILSELVNNTIKHSGAKNVSLDLKFTRTQLLITYLDDGMGYLVSKNPLQNKGMGLQNIRNRVNLLGGTIEFVNQCGKTIVKISKPIE